MENVVKNGFKNENFKNLRVKNLCIMAFMLVFCGLFYSCNDNEQATNPNFEAITGKFLNKEGKPVAGIIVEATDRNGKVFSTDVTDANGFFKIQNMPNELTYGVVSFVDANADEIIHQEKLENVVNACNNASGKVGNIFQGGDNDCEAVFKLTIKDAETKLTIQDARVVLGTSQNAFFKKITDAQGNVFFENIVPGKYTLTVTKTDYATYQENFLLLFPEGIDTLRWTVELNKRGNDTTWNDSDSSKLCCTNSVSFYVYDKETQKKITTFANTNSVIITPTSGYVHEIQPTTFLNDGKVVFEGLCKGRYSIRVNIGGYEVYEEGLYVECGKNQELNVYLSKKKESCCDNQIIVYIQDSANQGIENVKVQLLILNNFKELTTDANGRVTFNNVCSGTYNIFIQEEDIGTQGFFPVQVTCKDTSYFLRHICNSGSIQITVMDTTNMMTPHFEAGAKVILKNNQQKILAELTTDGNGIVKFTNLPIGVYTVSIDDDKYSYYYGPLVIRLEECKGYENILPVIKK